jgi:hypothetical protein
MIGILHDPQPRVAIDRPGETVDLEGRRRHHGQHVAVARIHHHHGAGLALHRPLGRFLHAPIDGGDDLGAGMRLGGLDQPHLPAHRVHLEALATVLAAQELVEQPLQPALAHHVAATIPTLLELLVAGLAHVAQQVGGEPAVGIGALRLDLHDHARQLQLPLLDLGDVVHAETAPHPHRKNRVGRHLGHRILKIGEGNLQQRGEPAQGGVALGRIALELARNQRQREGRPVVHQRQAVAIEQNAAGGRDGADADAVLVRRLLEAAALQHLQIPELADDHEQRAARDTGHGHDPAAPGVGPTGHAPTEVAEPRVAHVVRCSFNDSAHVSARTSAAPRKPL